MSKLKVTKGKLEQPAQFTQVRIIPNELVGNTIVIASEQDVFSIKATDLFDFILEQEKEVKSD